LLYRHMRIYSCITIFFLTEIHMKVMV
jgi:hypothetical protein